MSWACFFWSKGGWKVTWLRYIKLHSSNYIAVKGGGGMRYNHQYKKHLNRQGIEWYGPNSGQRDDECLAWTWAKSLFLYSINSWPLVLLNSSNYRLGRGYFKSFCRWLIEIQSSRLLCPELCQLGIILHSSILLLLLHYCHKYHDIVEIICLASYLGRSYCTWGQSYHIQVEKGNRVQNITIQL